MTLFGGYDEHELSKMQSSVRKPAIQITFESSAGFNDSLEEENIQFYKQLPLSKDSQIKIQTPKQQRETARFEGTNSNDSINNQPLVNKLFPPQVELVPLKSFDIPLSGQHD